MEASATGEGVSMPRLFPVWSDSFRGFDHPLKRAAMGKWWSVADIVTRVF